MTDAARFRPTITPQRSNQGWMVSVSIPEAATGISWRMGSKGPYAETGFLAIPDQRTGKPMPNPSFAVPDDAKAYVIASSISTCAAARPARSAARFDPEAALIEGNKQIMEQFWTSWIAFDASGNTGLVYYSQMLSYRCGIREVRYSLNGESSRQGDRHAALQSEGSLRASRRLFLPYFKVGPEVTSMAVQVTYADGSTSPVRTFNR